MDRQYLIDIRRIVRLSDMRTRWEVSLNGEVDAAFGSSEAARRHAETLWSKRPDWCRTAEAIYTGR